MIIIILHARTHAHIDAYGTKLHSEHGRTLVRVQH